MGTRINYEIIGDDGLAICILFSDGIYPPDIDAERIFLNAVKITTSPTDLIEMLLRIRYLALTSQQSADARMFLIDTSPGDRERVIRVHYGVEAKGRVEVSTDGTRWIPMPETKHDDPLNQPMIEPPSQEQSISASVARGSYLTTYVSREGDVTGITFINSLEVDREMFSSASKGLFTQKDLYAYAVKRQNFIRTQARATHLPRRAQ